MTDFGVIYSQYFADVYKYALSVCRNETLAEEITQETFFKALKSIDKFKGDCKIRVWLCQIAKNTYFSLCQKNKHITDESHEETEGECIEQKLINSETVREIHKTLHFLNQPYKEVFTLRVFGELSFLQIAELFGKTESWARVTFHRAKIKLKEGLK
ncbi:RNA polymerase sigma factor [Clostridium tagluense]|uniref:RNA polymerase sigma factor n=1 Tax=Clostridium tagluense TaxID=360422 RepID=UPI001CF3B2B5|nr:sigma-70 family RNA polymerase sigma factor [Clostridium tagluense]MCB2300061.1 sigma-70 family RNA polymerase sigma factor [Clostridium tagluense]